jgi:diguanylate cyclase (GGDEF)-like protein
MADVGTTVWAGQGTSLNVHVYFLLFAILSPTMFGVEQRRSIVLLVCANVVIYAWLEMFGWPAHPALDRLDPRVLQALRVTIMVSCGLIIVLMATLTEVAAEANERHLQKLATTDPLTGLANRRRFMDMLAAESHRAQREREQVSLLVFDVDRFKAVNDLLGHDGGDQALLFISRWAVECTRPYDLVARIGGEEFAVLLPMTGSAEAGEVAERFRQALSEEPFVYKHHASTITVSIGAVTLSPGDDLDGALRRADEALYMAKRDGRDCVRFSVQAG